MGTTAPQSLRPEDSRCPACHYDMTGVLVPTCPECGIDAVAERRRRQAAGPLRYRPVTPDSLVPCAAFLLIFGCIPHFDGRDLHSYDLDVWRTFIVTGWIVVARWLWLTRQRIFVNGQLWRLLLSVTLVIFPSWTLAKEQRFYDVDALIGLASLGLLTTYGVWILTSSRQIWTLLFTLGATIMAPGLGLILEHAWNAAKDNVWSPFTDPRTGQIYDQYPLRWDEVATLGPGVALAGAFVVMGALLLRRRAMRNGDT